MVDMASQLAWSVAHLRAHGAQLLADAGYPAAAAALDPALLDAALDAVVAHVDTEGDVRAHAIAQDCWWPNGLALPLRPSRLGARRVRRAACAGPARCTGSAS